MNFFRFWRLPASSAAVILAAQVSSISNAEIIYKNTQRLNSYRPELREHGDQLSLAGTARTLTDIYIEAYADFVPQGNELVIVRVYSNERQYDIYRKEPTTLLYSGSQPLTLGQNGYSTIHLDSLALEVPDIITVTVEPVGLDPDELFGLPIASPAAIGGPTQSGRVGSDNEFWRRIEQGDWEVFRNTDLSLPLNAIIQVVAVPERGVIAIFACGAFFLFRRGSRK